MIRAATRHSARFASDDALRVLGHPFALPEGECRIEAALGAAVAAVPHDDDIRLLEEAEQALADAQVEGRLIVREMAVPTDGSTASRWRMN